MLDTARVFPPEFHRNRQIIYSCKFRPEFVKNYSTPLSSDSITNFQTKSNNQRENDKNGK